MEALCRNHLAILYNLRSAAEFPTQQLQNIHWLIKTCCHMVAEILRFHSVFSGGNRDIPAEQKKLEILWIPFSSKALLPIVQWKNQRGPAAHFASKSAVCQNGHGRCWKSKNYRGGTPLCVDMGYSCNQKNLKWATHSYGLMESILRSMKKPHFFSQFPLIKSSTVIWYVIVSYQKDRNFPALLPLQALP